MNIHPWTHCQDIQIPEVEIRKQFDAEMSAGRYAEAIKVLNGNKEKLRGRAYVAKVINEIVDLITYLELGFVDGVDNYIDTLSVEFNKMIDNFRYLETWNINVKYEPYNFVLYNDDIYMVLESVPLGEVPADNVFWLKLGLKGQDGAYGVEGLRLRYQWILNADYVKGDIVVYQGSVYVALKPNTNIRPTEDDTAWLLFLRVEKGKINVGVNPPANNPINTIWIKTNVDPLISDVPVIGHVQRTYIGEGPGIWQSMNPATFSTLVLGKEQYSSKPKIRNVIIPVEAWGYLRGEYVYILNEIGVKENTYVSVSPGLTVGDKYRGYSDLTMDVDIGQITFKIPYKPTEQIRMRIVLQ